MGRAAGDCGAKGILLAHSPIVPFVVGEADRTLRAAEMLRAEGYLAGAVRPRTVPEGTSRLRFAASALHTEEQIRDLSERMRALRAAL